VQDDGGQVRYVAELHRVRVPVETGDEQEMPAGCRPMVHQLPHTWA